ncbi:MAG: hypothetical protein A2Z83_06995 [Omnitrophica bacterium GWA2_52_8]|nr:MAG: hypothetical protein A2Z83_06995 [Omnitrophica bacterium GWA2_52_8]
MHKSFNILSSPHVLSGDLTLVLPAKFRGGSAPGGDSRFSLRLIRLWRKKSAGMTAHKYEKAFE